MTTPALCSSSSQGQSSGVIVNQKSGLGGSRSGVSKNAPRRVRKFCLDPCEKLHRSFYNDPNAPLMFYGWAWKDDYLMDYAARHHLSYHLGDLVLHYSDLAKPGFCKENFKYYHVLECEVPEVVRKHLQARCGFRLTMEFIDMDLPESKEYDGMFGLYSNRNAGHIEVLLRPGYDQFMKSLGIIHTAMNEKGNKSDLLWWHCHDKYA